MLRPRSFLCLLSVLLASCWQSSNPSSEGLGGTQEVINGQEAEPAMYPSVLFWGPQSTIKGKENSLSDGCTCSLVGPKTCLTAAHCLIVGKEVFVDKDGNEVSEYGRSSGIRLLTAKEEIEKFKKVTLFFSNAKDTAVDDKLGEKVSWETKATKIEFYPTFMDKYAEIAGRDVYQALTGNAQFPDIALVTLGETPLDAMPGLTTVAVDLRPVVPPEELTFVGYGCHSESSSPAPGDTSGKNYDGILRAGVVEVSSYQKTLLDLGWLQKRAETKAKALAVEYPSGFLVKGGAFRGRPETCFGDSGGPLLRAVNDKIWAPNGHAVVGITSAFFPAESLGIVTLDGKLDVTPAGLEKLRPEYVKNRRFSILNRFTSLSDGPVFQTGTWLKSFGDEVVKVFDSKKP